MKASLERHLLPVQRQILRTGHALRLLNALNSEDRGLKVRFSLATIAFDRESAQMSQILSSQGKNAPSNPYPHYFVRLATSRCALENCAKLVHRAFLKSQKFGRKMGGGIRNVQRLCKI